MALVQDARVTLWLRLDEGGGSDLLSQTETKSPVRWVPVRDANRVPPPSSLILFLLLLGLGARRPVPASPCGARAGPQEAG